MKKNFTTKADVLKMFTYRMARVPLVYDNIKVVVESEENIFDDVYVTGVLPNNRVVRFKKSALEFTA